MSAPHGEGKDDWGLRRPLPCGPRCPSARLSPGPTYNSGLPMSTIEAEVDALRAEALEALAQADGEAGREAWRADWLGRKDGRLTLRLRSLKDAPPDQRAALGKSLNALKATLEGELEGRREAARADALATLSADAALDVTLPGPSPVPGPPPPRHADHERLHRRLRGDGLPRLRGPRGRVVALQLRCRPHPRRPPRP